MPTRRRACQSHRSRARQPKRPEQRLRFLDLPAEVRNSIYQYVLTIPGGVIVRWFLGSGRQRLRPVMFVDSGENDLEIWKLQDTVNMLHLVCQQLRKETAGLEIQYNRVIFRGYSKVDKGAIHALLAFTKFCTPSRLQWLTHVEVVTRWGPKPKYRNRKQGEDPLFWIKHHALEVENLMQLCAEQPRLRVDLRVPGFDVHSVGLCRPLQLVVRGMILVWIFKRGQVPNMGCGQAIWDYAKRRASQILGHKLQHLEQMSHHAQNLRFFPCEPSRDEPLVEEHMHYDDLDGPVGMALGSADACLAHARRWFASGV
jgi:hypothetical protein